MNNAATLSPTLGNKNIIVITCMSLLLHGIGLAVFWQEPLFQFEESPTHSIAVELTTTQALEEASQPAADLASDTEVKPQQKVHTPSPPSPTELSKNIDNLQPAQEIKSVTPPKPQTEPRKIEETTPRLTQPLEASTISPSKISNTTQVTTANASTLTPPDIPVKTFSAPFKPTRDALRLELHKYIVRTYPLVARKRGWEGKVQLGFQVTSLGYIKDIHVINSSGHSTLDKSAVRSLSKIKQLSLAKTLLSQDIEMDMTIEYKLAIH